MRIPWTARSNQSILKEVNPENSLEGLRLKLTLQYFGHLMQRADSLEKTLVLGKIEGKSRMGCQRIGWRDGITFLMGMSLSKLRDNENRRAWFGAVIRLQRVGSDLATEQREKRDQAQVSNLYFVRFSP